MSTIVAPSTPIGRGAIAIIRLSGDAALTIVTTLCREIDNVKARRATLGRIRYPNTGETIDEVLITYFQKPNSVTGEDVIEIGCHGSPTVVRQILDQTLSLGARLAEPGEFSLRALFNGQMDLTEAEAIRDLIDARSIASARQAVRQLSGEFSHELKPIKDELLDVIVLLESALEFVEDDLPEFQVRGVVEKLSSIKKTIEKVAGTYKAGHLLRDGLRVAIVGRPNVGKSSLFNALLGSDRAIVTDIAGTTRE